LVAAPHNVRLAISLDGLEKVVDQRLDDSLPVLGDKWDKIVCGRSVRLDSSGDTAFVLRPLLGGDSVDVLWKGGS
jgi:hypothetical protein